MWCQQWPQILKFESNNPEAVKLEHSQLVKRSNVGQHIIQHGSDYIKQVHYGVGPKGCLASSIHELFKN